jgi:NAD(P)H-dependent FMN reductase
MSRKRILLVCGSLRAGSTNAAVLATAAELAGSAHDTRYFDGLGRLPHFNPDDDTEPLPAAVGALRSALAEADGVLFCTPEYAGALPGSFKNLLDWTIGGHEIYGKPVAWINASGPAAPTGGADAHDSLRKVLTYAGAAIVEEACVRIPVTRDVVADGTIRDASMRAEIGSALEALARGAG